MNKIIKQLRSITQTVNFEGLRCTVKGDPSIREIKRALYRQKEIDQQVKSNSPKTDPNLPLK